MEIEIKPGLYCEEEYIVKEDHLASRIGSGGVDVLATPMMIAFMENTALRCVEKLLPEGYITVGIMINVRHLNPAPVGAHIKVAAKLVNVEGRKLVFDVKAYWGNVLIGEGTHERFIVNKDRFMEKVRYMMK